MGREPAPLFLIVLLTIHLLLHFPFSHRLTGHSQKIPCTTTCNAWDVNYAVPPCLPRPDSSSLQQLASVAGTSHSARNAGLRTGLGSLRGGLPMCSRRGTFSSDPEAESLRSRFLSLCTFCTGTRLINVLYVPILLSKICSVKCIFQESFSLTLDMCISYNNSCKKINLYIYHYQIQKGTSQ